MFLRWDHILDCTPLSARQDVEYLIDMLRELLSPL